MVSETPGELSEFLKLKKTTVNMTGGGGGGGGGGMERQQHFA